MILKRTVEVGALAGPTSPAFTVADTRVVKVVFGVPDVIVARLKPGGRLTIQAEALPGATLQGQITRISPSADPNSRVFEVEAALPNPGERHEGGDARHAAGRARAPWAVPSSCRSRPSSGPPAIPPAMPCMWSATRPAPRRPSSAGSAWARSAAI